MQDNRNDTNGGPPSDGNWERELLTRLAMSSVNEQRRARRWRIFFVLLGFAYVGLFLLLLARPGLEQGGSGSHTAVVNISGLIGPESRASADLIIKGLRAAFEHENTRGVVLRINSPGGSPVQSDYIYDEMVRLRNKHPDIPLYAVIEDVGASGGYYVAAGAEKIYAAPASLIGSIGVRLGGFGFVEAMEKVGVERRVLTAGEHKALMDPFLPQEETEMRHLQGVIEEVHQQFIDAVKTQRGDRLVDRQTVFSGLVWTGEKGVALGLVDALGSVDYVAREVVGEKTVRDFTYREDLFTRLSRNLSAALVEALQAGALPRLQAVPAY